jgi:hypothetical protein
MRAEPKVDLSYVVSPQGGYKERPCTVRASPPKPEARHSTARATDKRLAACAGVRIEPCLFSLLLSGNYQAAARRRVPLQEARGPLFPQQIRSGPTEREVMGSFSAEVESTICG